MLVVLSCTALAATANAATQEKVRADAESAFVAASFGASRPWRIEGPDSVAIPMIQVGGGPT